MFCTNCGTQLPEGSKFCNICGQKVDNTFNNQRNIHKMVSSPTVYKCPNCGDSIDSFASKCKSCGAELHNINSTTSIKEFEKELQQIESTRKVKNGLEKFASALAISADDVDIKIANHIKNFVIPNSKEDIFEFLILAASNIDSNAYDHRSNTSYQESQGKFAISDAWESKFNQAFQKALLSFPEDNRLSSVKNLYDQKKRDIEFNKREKQRNKNKSLLLGIGLIIIYFIFMLLLFKVLA